MSEPTYLHDKIEVYRCDYCPENAACGFDGSSYDHSYDECHHPFDHAEANRLVACWNALRGIPSSAITDDRFNKLLHQLADSAITDEPGLSQGTGYMLGKLIAMRHAEEMAK